MPQTRWAFQVYFVVPEAKQAVINAELQKHGFGPDNLMRGLSTTGEEPAQAYHAQLSIKGKHLALIKRLADSIPKAWIWLRVRTRYIQTQQDLKYARLIKNFDLAAYQDLNRNTRTKAYVKVSAVSSDQDQIDEDVAISWINNNAVPALNLQKIESV